MKYADAPRLSRSMHVAIADLGLTRLHVVYPGTEAYPLADRIEVLPLGDMLGRIAALRGPGKVRQGSGVATRP